MDKRFSDMIQQSAKGSLILIIGQTLSTLFSAIGAILVARILGSSSYGLISIAQIPINITEILLQNGVTNAIITFIVEARSEENEEKISSIIRAGFIINLIIGLFSTGALFLLAGYLSNQVYGNPDLHRLIQILSFSVLAKAFMSTSATIIVGFEDMKQRSIINILYSVLKSIIGPILVYLGYGVVGAAYGRVTPHLFTAFIAFIYVIRKSPKSRISQFSDLENIKKIIIYSYPLFFSNLLSKSLSQALNFILPLYVSVQLMGNYGAASNFTALISFFITPINTATFPLFSKLKPEDSVFEYIYQNVIKYQTLVVYPIIAAVIALSGQLVQILYGSDYQDASFFLQILMLSYLFVGFGSTVTGQIFNSQKQTKIILRKTILYLLFGAPLGFYLIPKFGIVGYQATELLAPIAGLIYSLWWARKNMGINVNIKSTLKIFISSVFGCLVGFISTSILKLNPFIEIIIGGVFIVVPYLISIILTGAFTRSDISNINTILSKYKIIKWFIEPTLSFIKRFARND